MTMQQTGGDTGSLKQLRSYSIGATSGVGVLLAVLVGAAALVQVDSAAVASGSIAVASGTQEIAHPLGGVVAQISVQDGDFVHEGDVLVELRTAQQDVSVASVEQQMVLATVKIARLKAEIAGASDFGVPEGVSADFAPDLVAAAKELELSVLAAHLAAASGQQLQAQARVDQLIVQGKGVDVDRAGVEQQLAAMEVELAALEAGSHTGDYETQHAALVLAISGARLELQGNALDKQAVNSAIREQRAQISQVGADSRNLALAELENSLQVEAQMRGQLDSLNESLADSQLRAPVDGIVYESLLDTVGGVVPAGVTLMKILPQESGLVVEARIAATDVDKAEVKGIVRVLFPAFNQNSTPQLRGSITSIAPDVTRDPASGATYYLARVTVTEEEIQRLPSGFLLTPGMPAEVFIETGSRSVLSYLFKPLSDRISHTFRED